LLPGVEDYSRPFSVIQGGNALTFQNEVMRLLIVHEDSAAAQDVEYPAVTPDRPDAARKERGAEAQATRPFSVSFI
jgi:hypothetical protein